MHQKLSTWEEEYDVKEEMLEVSTKKKRKKNKKV